MKKLTWTGTAFSAASIYLLFFDTVPFAAPWGVVAGVIAILCYKEVLKERFQK